MQRGKQQHPRERDGLDWARPRFQREELLKSVAVEYVGIKDGTSLLLPLDGLLQPFGVVLIDETLMQFLRARRYGELLEPCDVSFTTMIFLKLSPMRFACQF